MKKSMKTNIIAVCTLSVISLLSINVSALDYQKTINVGFNIQDTLTVSLSSPNLIIDDLMPGTASDSNIITVNVLSNNPYGYTLNSTVGSTTYANRNLTHSSSASATPFSSINYGTTVADLSSFSPNQWGYSFSTDNGTTWINSNKTDGTTNDTGYSGLPFYTDTENITTLKESSTTSAAAGDNIQFKIAAKADATQLSGEYNNIINFVLTGAPAPPSCQSTISGTMQDFNPCSDIAIGTTGTLTDSRDTQDYTIAKLADGKYWMLDNLRLDPATATLNTSNTNMNASVTPTYTNTTSDFNSYTAAQFNADYKDNTTTSFGSGSGKVGVYYNYCAASAGTICTDSNTSNASYDLCPAGWRMPTGGSSGEYQALYTAYSSDVTNFRNALSTPLSGFFYNSSQYSLGASGHFWSSTRYDNTYMYFLYVSWSLVYPQRNDDRGAGFSIRCVTK